MMPLIRIVNSFKKKVKKTDATLHFTWSKKEEKKRGQLFGLFLSYKKFIVISLLLMKRDLRKHVR